LTDAELMLVMQWLKPRPLFSNGPTSTWWASPKRSFA